MTKRRRGQRGAAMVEFAIVLFLLLSVIMAGFEFDRMLMSYTSLANAARVGVRYAIVHGATRSATVGDPPITASNDSTVIAYVKSWAKLGFLDPNSLTVAVSTTGGTTPGSTVNVTVTYPYTPLTFVPLSLTLRASSSGIIVF
jgi:Flp pilus assembly protein TadG